MRFWDSSALVPLLIEEEASEAALSAYSRDDGVLVWWATEVECCSALARLEREDALDRRALAAAHGRLDAVLAAATEVSANAPIKRIARRLLRTHDLRAADGLQLAAALSSSEGRPSSLTFVCLDERLSLAAEREGLDVLDRDRLLG